jgi:uncharacterized protein YukE
VAKIPDNIVSIMMVDNAGAVVSVPVSDFISATTTTVVSAPVVIPSGKQPKAEVINTTIETSVAIEADPNYLVMPNSTQDNLVNSVAYQSANKIGLNTKSPSFLLDVKGDSINIGSSSLTNGYRISSLLVASASSTLKTIYLGDDTKLNIINLYSLIIEGLIPVTATGIDRILFINDLGEVTAKTDIFLESLNTLTNKNQVFAFGTSGTTPNVVSTVVSTTGTHTFNFPLASTAGVTAGLISKAQYDIFNAKEPAITIGTTSQYYRGDKTFQTLNTTAVAEGTNLYYTDTRARLSISGGTGITYNSTTGVITNTITQYTDALARASISLTTTGSGAATYNSTTGVLNVPTFTISGLSAGGELSGTYPNPSLLNSAVVGKVLTGYYTLSGIVSATDTILQAFGKVQNQLNSLSGSLSYQGSWNASTNTPTIVSSTGTNGHYYIVNVAGTTTIDGISSWAIGDWIVFNGSTWQKIANQSVTSVNGLSGVVILTTTNLSEGTNLYYTDARARAAISVSGSLSYNSGTGVISYTTPSTSGITEGSNLYYTDARARASISGGTGISYSSSTGIINSTITQYTDVLARAAISGGTGITYDSGTGVINSAITQYTDALARASLSGSSGITYNSSTGAISYSGIVYTNASIRALISGGTGITYDSGTGVINSTITQYTNALARAAISGGTGISYSSSTGVITSLITQYTDALARAAISGGTGISYSSSTGVINSNITQYTDALARASISGSASISYNSTTGVISSNITQYTDALARAAISVSTSGTSGAATYNSSTGVINIPQYQGGVTSIVAGTNITISSGTGAVTINAAGSVTSVAATSSIGLTITNSPITTSGTLVIGSINDDLRMRSLRVGSWTGLNFPNAVDGKIEASGDIVGFSASDERLKENIKVIEDATDKLSRIRGVKFDWKKEFEYIHGYEGADIGVIAQDVEVEFPEAIQQRETGYLAVRYEKLIGLLIAGFNEQSKKIKELESKIK